MALRSLAGTFAGLLPTHVVLDGIAGVIREADGLAISPATFNACRRDLDPPLPSAQAICARLRVGWPQVRRLAVCKPESRGRLLGNLTANTHPTLAPDSVMIRALRAAALEMGEPLSSDSYALMVPRLVAAYGHADRHLELPRSDLLIKRHGSWAAVLEWAGLQPHDGVPPNTVARPAVEILDEFITEHGVIPPSNWFQPWCRSQGILLGRDARRWRDTVDETRRRRTARGAETPTGLPPFADLWAIPERVLGPDAPSAPPIGARGYTREQVIASLRLYGAEHLKGAQPRYRHYRSASARDPRLVSVGCFDRHGRFQDLCREAGI